MEEDRSGEEEVIYERRINKKEKRKKKVPKRNCGSGSIHFLVNGMYSSLQERTTGLADVILRDILYTCPCVFYR